MDNEENYVSYGELLLEMGLSGNDKVTKSVLTLSNLSADPSGDTFDFAKASGTDQDPAIGMVIAQGGVVSCIISIPSAGKLKVADTEKILVGQSDLLSSASVPKYYGEELIVEAMQIIDELTGSYFNKRTGTFSIEGNNTGLMHLPVPIIQVDELLVNSTNTELFEGEDRDFIAFKGRLTPTDDRKNPRIKLNIGRGRDSIFVSSLTSRAFIKNTLTHITGSFGYLELDGSTPAAIKRATKILVMKDIENPITQSQDATDNTGPLKRLKVDLHEQEFFEPSQNKDSSRSSSSGDVTIDRIIARYRTPIRIKGSFRIRKLNEDDAIRSGQII